MTISFSHPDADDVASFSDNVLVDIISWNLKPPLFQLRSLFPSSDTVFLIPNTETIQVLYYWLAVSLHSQNVLYQKGTSKKDDREVWGNMWSC